MNGPKYSYLSHRRDRCSCYFFEVNNALSHLEICPGLGGDRGDRPGRR